MRERGGNHGGDEPLAGENRLAGELLAQDLQARREQRTTGRGHPGEPAAPAPLVFFARQLRLFGAHGSR